VSTHSAQPPWTGMVPVDDTALAVTDTRGPGIPVLYLNGQFATQRHWRRVIAELGGDYRHITYDERARGRSKRSADSSFQAWIRDVDAILKARGVDRSLLVGWSYGAVVAVHWASLNPDRAAGVVSVDGAYPLDSYWAGDAAAERIRKLWRRWRLLLPLTSRLGLGGARMSADQHAQSNIELNRICAAIGPVLDGVTVPVRYVVASGEAMGSSGDDHERMRAALEPHLARNPNIRVSAKVASNHSKILRKDFRAVADAVRELVTTHDQEANR
jgi:pimeloyl-ACP methyl ester carboxylesterase